MKISKVIVLAFVVTAVCGTIVLNNSLAQDGSVTRQARPTAVAVCNVFNVLQKCHETKDRSASTLALQASAQTEMQKRLATINEIKAEMGGLDPDSQEYERRLEEVERLSLEAETWRKLMSAKVIRRETKAHIAMYEKLQKAASQIASENGYDIVLFKTEFDMPEQPTMQILSERIRERIVLYNNDQVDITDAILIRLNELYKSAKDK